MNDVVNIPGEQKSNEANIVDYISLGLRIKHIRERRGLSQSMLAAKCKITEEDIVSIENGVAKVSVNTIVDIANTLDVCVGFLLADSLKHESVCTGEKGTVLLELLMEYI